MLDGYLRGIILSIHDLTRRSTGRTYHEQIRGKLSIHDLTRRSTMRIGGVARLMDLSIHDLTRRSTSITINGIPSSAFQFTTSQGGRQQIHTIFAQKITNILFIFHKVLTQFYILLNIFPLLYHLSSPFPVRISRSFSVHFTSALEDQSFRHIKTRFYPYVFHFTFVFVTQIIKSQAICLFINDIL